MANRKHFAVLPKPNTAPEFIRLWDYYRLNRTQFPTLGGKLDKEVRTVGIKNALKKNGWKIVENPTEVWLIKPDEKVNIGYI